MRGILRAYSKGDERADVAEHSMPDFGRQLMQILVSDDKPDSILAQFRKHIRQRECRKALKFVDVDEEVAPLRRRSVYSRVRCET